MTPLALKLSPMIGAAAMSCSSLFVVGNALRLNFFQPLKTKSKTVSVCNGHCEIQPKGETVMKYQLTIEGMMCGHCTARVEKVLKAVGGVSEVTVSLENKTATVCCENVSGETLRQAVEAQDYQVTAVVEL